MIGFVEDKATETIEENINTEEDIKLESFFVNKSQTFAILNEKQFNINLRRFSSINYEYDLCYLNDFRIGSDEHLVPDKLYHKDNTSWYYEYYLFYKTKKMLRILFPKSSDLINMGLYYCEKQSAPLFIVNNIHEIEICLAIAPQVVVDED